MSVVIIMGVAGSGKTTIARKLAANIDGMKFLDADDFHPESNIAKMSAGIPLTDEDRQPWLQSLRAQISKSLSGPENLVLACSALKDSYRQILLVDKSKVCFVYLKGSQDLLKQRLSGRKKHFMKEAMLESQLQALEEPAEQEALILDASQSPKLIVKAIELRLRTLH